MAPGFPRLAETGRLVIAIDGPAASGKGTLARRLAERFGLAHLDTGKLYRATALAVLDAGGDPADPEAAENAAQHIDFSRLADPRLLREEISRASSVVAAIPAVRAALLEAQRRFAHHPPPLGNTPARAPSSTAGISARRSVRTRI